YLDENNWEEIDNRIGANTGNNSLTHPYACERNSVKTYFPLDPFKDHIIMNTNEGTFREKVVAIRFLDAAGNVLSDLPLTASINTKAEGNKISYSGFDPELSLEYTLGNDSRKFDIVIQSSGFLSS